MLSWCDYRKSIYETQIVNQVNTLKKNVLGDTNIVLHETDINSANKESFKIMRKEENRTVFWNEMSNIFTNSDLVAIGAAINILLLLVM